MKWLKRLSLGTLALVATLVLLVSLALNTEWGARTVMHRLAPMAPGQLETGRVSGTLSGPLVLEDFEYRTGPVTLRADRLRLDLAVLELLTSRVRVDRAAIEGFELVVEAGDTEPGDAGSVELPSLSLPVSIDVRSLSVNGARFSLPGQPALELQNLSLEGTLAGGRLQLDRFRLEGLPGRASMRGSVDTTARYRTDLTAQVALYRPDTPLEGTVSLQGDLDRLAVVLESRPPVAARLEATLTGLPWPPAFEATLALESMPPALLGAKQLPGPLSGRLQASGDPGNLQLEGRLAAGDERVDIRRLALGREGARLDLHALRIEGRDGARVEASGILALGGETPRIILDARWRDVAIPLGDGGVLASPGGNVALDGRPSAYSARGEVRLDGIAPAGTWRFAGQGDTAHFALESLDVETMEGSLSATGRVAWSPRVEWSVDASGSGLDPSVLMPGWPGALGFRAATEGRLADGRPAGTVVVERLEGRLRGRPLDGSADLAFRGLERVSGSAGLRSGDSRLRAEGRLAADVDLRLRFDVNRAGDWYPDASGSFSGTFAVTGPRDAPHVGGGLEGSSLAFGDHRAGSLDLSIDAGLAADADPGRVDLTLRDGRLAGVALNRLNLALHGNRSSHRLELQAVDDERQLALTAQGGLDAGAWSGGVTALTLAGPRLGLWRLAEPAPVTVGPARAMLAPLCLHSAAGELCARGDWSAAAGLQGRARLAGVPLALGELPLRAVMDRPVELSGRLDLETDIRWPAGGAPGIQARLEAHEAGVALAGTEGLMRLGLSPLEGTLSLHGRELETQLGVGLDRAGSLSLELRSGDFEPSAWAASPVSGRLEVALSDISPLGLVSGPLAAPRGALNGELSIDGALGALGLGGSLVLSDFSAQVPRAGITLERGRAEIRARAGSLVFTAGAVSGGGDLNAEGRVGIDPDGTVTGEARVRGRDFLAADLPGVEAWISPELDLSLADRRLDIGGSVTVPRANVDAGKLQGGGVSASPDVIVAGKAPAEAPPAITWRAEVDVILGEDIALLAPGFEGSADGRLHVSERPGRPPLGQGQLAVSGTYEAYGQNLSIRSGRLLFSDTPLDNPALDVTAVRVTRDVTAGVRIGGTAHQPRLSLFSEPALGSESQILSYLILGRPLDSVSSSEGATLAGAAASVGLKGGNLLAQQLGARFGLEEVEVGQSDALGQSALTLGKYLSPRLYIGYGVGLVEPVSVVRLRYELSERWALEAASGKETTAAIKFNYER